MSAVWLKRGRLLEASCDYSVQVACATAAVDFSRPMVAARHDHGGAGHSLGRATLFLLTLIDVLWLGLALSLLAAVADQMAALAGVDHGSLVRGEHPRLSVKRAVTCVS